MVSQIRLCREDERDRIFTIVNAAAEAYRETIPPDRWSEPYMPMDELDHEIADGVRFWGYEVDGELVGVMGIQTVRDVDLIRHAYVLKSQQGRGVGGALIKHLREVATRPMLVGTWADAAWAIRFYERHGFELVSAVEKDRLLRKYWSIPERQIETSVVLADPTFLAASNVRFTGNIPEIYDRYLGFLFEPFAQDLAQRVARLRPRKVLEIAAGTGIATRRLLEALPEASHLTVTDLNEPMLEYAREKIGEDPRATFRQADALDLPFSDGEFDVVACQFGVMFFPDKVQGLREFKRVLVRGGTLLFNTWDVIEANPHGQTAHNAIRESFEIDPPAFYEVPFGFHDVAEIRRVAADAGFTEIEIETIDKSGETPSAAEAAIGLIRGNPCINVIMERGPERLADIESLAARTLAERFGNNPLRLPLRAHVLSAVAGQGA